MRSLMLSTAVLASLPLFALAQPDLAAEIESTYDPKIESKTLGTDRSLYGCPIEEMQILGADPVTRAKRAVKVTTYRPRGASVDKGTVIILPPTGGVNILDQGYANEFCTSGLTVALVSGWEHQLETTLDFSMHDHGALRALAATRHVVEFLASENRRSIGLLGTSVGAIAGALVLGFETRISSAALIVGSANFADVIAASDEKGAKALREKRMSALGLKTFEEYKAAVRKAVRIEPSAFIGRSGAKRALLITADTDTTVPTADQLELVGLLNAETHISLHGNHFEVIKSAYFQRRAEVAKFFLRALN